MRSPRSGTARAPVTRFRERRTASLRSPAPTFLDPSEDRVRVGPGLAAQHGGLALDRLVQLALPGAFLNPGDLGQQVGAPVCSSHIPGQADGAGDTNDVNLVTPRARE
jgi:hypothetical protein